MVKVRGVGCGIRTEYENDGEIGEIPDYFPFIQRILRTVFNDDSESAN
jgi:hypothetical protein